MYSFKYSFDGLKIIEFGCTLEWMLTICFFRGTLKEFAESSKVRKIVKKIADADVVIAPIADNKMFYNANITNIIVLGFATMKLLCITI